jgi:exo-beta-1,3-glucanase (GH17 family)
MRLPHTFVILVMLGCLASQAAAYDRQYIGVDYKGFPQTEAEITADIQLLAPSFGYLRTYNSLFGPSSPENAVVKIVAANNQADPSHTMQVAVGVAQTPRDSAASYAEINQAVLNAKTYPTAVNAIVIGNENLGNISEPDLIGYINYTKTQIQNANLKNVAVVTCQTWGVLAGHPNLVNAADYVLANIYPYFDGPGYAGGDPVKAGQDTLANWEADFQSEYGQLVSKYGATKVKIGETGWPSGGSQASIDGHYTGIPSVPNEKTYITQYAQFASTNKIFTYLFEGIDEPNKSPEPGDVQGHWGLYTANNQPKWGIGATSPVPLPSSLILLSSGLMGVLGMGWRFKRS